MKIKRRNVLMGVLTLTLPAGMVIGAQSVASAAKPPPNPIQCNGFSGTVNFGTPLSTAGVVTTSSKSNPTSLSGTSGTCSGHALSVPGGLSIAGGKNAKNPNYNKKSCKASPSDTTVCDKYVTGTWAEFASSGGSLKKELKVINFSIGGVATQFKTKSASEVIGGACGSAVGFQINGQVKSGTYNTKSATILACLTGDGGGSASGNFGADYNTAQGVTFATIGGNSNATL